VSTHSRGLGQRGHDADRVRVGGALDYKRESDSGVHVIASAPVRASRPSRRLGILDEVRLALHPRNRAAAYLGAALGGGVPAATYQLAHHELARGPVVWALVAGGLLFSALTVVRWATSAFGSPVKAFGFTVLLEGVLLYSSTTWLSIAALLYLVFINAVATGVRLALEGRRP
jgi:hypothetical protein